MKAQENGEVVMRDSKSPDAAERDQQDKRQSLLRDQWRSFATVMLNPAIMVFLVAAVWLVYLSAYGPDRIRTEPILLAFVSVLASLASGLAGAFIARQWSKVTESGVLATRGKSAIRGLRLLLLHLSQVENRVKTHLDRARALKDDSSLSNSYEEIILHCRALQEEAINSVEEWQDIIPEANVKTLIGVLTALQEDTVRYQERVEALERQVAESQDQSKEKQAALRTELGETHKMLADANRKLRDRELRFDSTILSGLAAAAAAGTGTLGISSSSPLRTSSWVQCPGCGSVLQLRSGEGINCPSCNRVVVPKPHSIITVKKDKDAT